MSTVINVNDAGQLMVTCPYEYLNKIKRLGGIWDSFASAWIFAFTPDIVERVIDEMPEPEVNPRVEEALNECHEKRNKLAKIRKMAKQDYPVRMKVPGLKGQLYNYQKLGVMFSITNGSGVLIGDSMGLGKSLQAIATAKYRKERGLASNALVVCPPSLKYNWAIEIEKWTDEPYVVIDGSPDKRVAQWLRDDVFFYIVNYELLLEDLFGGSKIEPKEGDSEKKKMEKLARKEKAEKRARMLSGVRNHRWGVAILDEAHTVKNASSKRSRNVRNLRCDFRMGLTGTPLDGKLEELHSVMQFISPGLLGSKTGFLQRHAVKGKNDEIVSYKHVAEVREKIKPFFIRRLKQDVLKDLPDKVYNNRMVQMGKGEMDVYKELAKQGHEATEDQSAFVSVLRCKQFCDSPSLVADAIEANEEEYDKRTVKRLRNMKSSKLEEFKTILQELIIENGNKVLVFSQYAEMVKILMNVFDDMGLNYLCIWGDTDKKLRAEYQEKFNTDKTTDIMIGTEAMSMGLNLYGAQYVINYDDNWAPACMNQREDRAHRIGQKSTVNVVNFICKGTIEERIREVLYTKASLTSQALGDNLDEAVLKRLGPRDVASKL